MSEQGDTSKEPEFNGKDLPEDQPVAPEPEPEPEPTHKLVEVTCGNCGSEFALPVEKHVTGFKFNCTNCGAENTVTGV